MRKLSAITVAIMLLVSLLCFGCATIQQLSSPKLSRLYEGKPRDPSTVAFFHTGLYGVFQAKRHGEWGAIDGGVERISIDGIEEVPFDGSKKKIFLSDLWIVELIPGKHTIQIHRASGYQLGANLNFPYNLEVRAKSGQKYRILRWQPMDVTTGLPVEFWISEVE